ncbi:hypothetical protein lerEdw1_019333 [Lerista edwardsae]|nr:hypothetical protein lerEdw1_019333 [Lerista edwardsae]
MAALQRREHSESDSILQTTRMAQDIDWLHCRASLCKVNLFSNDQMKGNRDRKLVCFVEVSSLNAANRDQYSKPSTSQSSGTDPPDGFDLEEKEIIVIKDEDKNIMDTEGAVCFFKQSHFEKGNVVNWLSNDLQKYAIGFQHALAPPNIPPNPKPAPYDAMAERIYPNSTPSFNCSGA